MNAAESYYNAMASKDLEGIAKQLHPDVQFISPLTEITGKDAVLEAAKGFMSAFNTLEIRATFSSGNETMFAYNLDFPSPVGVSRVAALITSKGDRIARIELFFDARPFEMKQ